MREWLGTFVATFVICAWLVVTAFFFSFIVEHGGPFPLVFFFILWVCASVATFFKTA